MRYLGWLLDQLDTGGDTARFAKIVWDDINNGCATARFNASELINHFEVKHPDSHEALAEMLVKSYIEFLRERKTRGWKDGI